MKRKILLAILMTGLSVLPALLATNNIVSLSNPETTVSLSPQNINKAWEQEHNRSLQVLDIFEINITVTSVTNLFGFKIKLHYNQNMLRFQSAKEGTMLNPPKDAFYSNDKPQDGELLVLQSSQKGAQPANDNGTLASIKFLCIKPGPVQLLLDPLVSEIWDPTYDPIERSLPPKPSDFQVQEISRLIPIEENYTLPADINITGSIPVLFSIMANNVVLDLNGHTVEGVRGRHAIEASKKAFTIKNGTIKNFQYAIKISECKQVNISDVTIQNARETAIKIEHSSEIHICNNKISDSQNECVELVNCSLSKISGNFLSKNHLYAIYMEDRSQNNTIFNNTISDNYPGGIYVHRSNNNIFFSNNFINNTDQAKRLNHVDSVESANSWNSSYPRGGNFWDDARTSKQIVDEWSGKNLTTTKIDGPDGIGDTPYIIDANNTDCYPLTDPYGQVLRMMCDKECVVSCKGETVHAEIHPVAIFSMSSITDFNLSTEGRISFNVINGTFCKIIVSKKLLDGALAIFVDDNLTASFLNSDETHIFANFTYSSGSHKVRIIGEFGFRILDSDINRDHKVNILDISEVAKDFDKEEKVIDVGGP